MVGNEFAGPRSKFPWRSVEASQQPSPEGCAGAAGAGPGLAAHPMVCASIRPSRASPSSGQRGHGEPILHPPSKLEHRDSAAMGTAQAKENPSIPSALGGRPVPGPRSPPARTEPTAALQEKPGTPGPTPVASTAEVSRRAERLRCRKVLRGVEKSRRQPGRAGSVSQLVLSTSATQLPVGERAACDASSVSIFSPAQTKFVGSQLLANSLDESRVKLA